MSKLIRIEIYKLFKLKKNRGLLIILLILILAVNIYYDEMYKNYIYELEKETSISYNSAQIRVNKAKTELHRLDSEEEIIKLALEKEYGTLEKAETMRAVFEKEIERNMKESNYAKAVMVAEKRLVKRQMKTGGKSSADNEDEALEKLLDLKIERINNIVEADKEKLVPESTLKLRKITMDDIRRKSVFYNYLADNDLSYDVNPYTSTGVLSIAKLLENNVILLIFIIFIFLSMDMFLSEVEEGSYKTAYTQPYERRKIFFSKVIGMVLFITLVFLIVLSLNFIINTILNGIGDFKEPLSVTENINKICLNNKNIEFKIISIGKSIILSIILFLAVVFCNIGFISLLSLFTDSTVRTMGIEISLLILFLLLRKFVLSNNLIHALSPLSYIFTQDVLTEKYNTNFNFGILLNLALTGIFLFISYRKFNSKDFLGSRS